MHRACVLIGPAVLLAWIGGCGGEGDFGGGGVGEIDSAEHAWGGYHWARTTSPFTLRLGDNVSPTWDPHLGVASSDWSESTVLDTAIVGGGTSPRRCRATNGQVEVCSEKYGFNGWLGVATIWVSGSHITRGTVKVNDSYFESTRYGYDTPEWRQLVVCQEVGHTLGLDHQDVSFDNGNLGTCMDYTSDPSTNQHPNQHDYDELVVIYTHLDDTTTLYGQAGAASAFPGGELPPQANGKEADDDGPAAWGKLVRRSADGRLEVYELDLGGGHEVIRFVIRA